MCYPLGARQNAVKRWATVKSQHSKQLSGNIASTRIHTLMDWFSVLICCGNGLEHMHELPFDKWVWKYALYHFSLGGNHSKILFFSSNGIWSRVDQGRSSWRIDIGNKVMLKHFYFFMLNEDLASVLFYVSNIHIIGKKRGVLTDYNVINAKSLKHERGIFTIQILLGF